MPGGRKRAYGVMPDGRKRSPDVVHPGRKRAHENRLAERKREIAKERMGGTKEELLKKIDSLIGSMESYGQLHNSDTNLLHIELMLEALDRMIHRSRSVDVQTELRRRKVKLHEEFQRQMEARGASIKRAAENARKRAAEKTPGK